MVAIFQQQLTGSLRGPIDWYLFLGWEGDPEVSNPIYQSIIFDDTGVPYNEQVPLPPILSVLMSSRTTVDISWTPAPGFTGPPIALWEIDVQTSIDDGVTFGAWSSILGSPFNADVFTQGLTGLLTGTPEVRFRYRARGINSDGTGAYSMYEVQWNGTIVNPPRPPSNLVASNVTSTSVLLSWTPSNFAALDGATKYGIWGPGNTNRNIDIDPNATSYLWTDLAQGTDYLNINIRRFNAGGWSGATNWVDFTTLRIRLTVDDPVMGQSVPDNTIPYRTQIPAIRVYNTGAMVSNFNQWQPRVIGYTDDPFSSGAPSDTTAAYVDHVKQMLDEFNQVAARRNCEVHVGYGNEVDRGWTTGDLSSAYINVYAGLRDLIWGTTGGVRDYPNASVWVDMTANNIRTKGAGPRFKAIAQYLDGMACSFYPAGRTISATNNIEYDPAGYPTGSLWVGNNRNAYKYYIDPIFTALADWRDSGGSNGTAIHAQLNGIACWEIGIPIHHSIDGDVGPWVRGGAVGIATDLTQKPRYLVGGAKVTGPAEEQYNFEGFLPYVLKKCDAEDVSMREMIYWNQQSNIHIPNLWETDAGRTSPDSVTAWYQWSPGFRLADI